MNQENEKIITVTFGCYVTFGKLASSDWEEDIELSENEYGRLIATMKESILNTGDDFCDSEDIKDIYDKVYEIVVESATESLLEYEYDMVKDYFIRQV